MDTSKPLRWLEKYEFELGEGIPSLVMPEVAKGLECYNRHEAKTGKVQKKPKVILDKIEALKLAIWKEGIELGLNLTNRGIDPDNVFILPSEEIIALDPDDYDDNVLGLNHGNFVFVSGDFPEPEILKILNHELIHHSSYCKILIRVDEKEEIALKTYRGGLMDNKLRNYGVLNEAMTEMINIDIYSRHWKDKPVLACSLPSPNLRNYGNLIVCVDGIAKDMSTKFDMSYQSVFDKMKTSYFTGDDDTYRMLQEAYGAKGIEAIASLPEDHDSTTRILYNPLGIVLPEEESGDPSALCDRLLDFPSSLYLFKETEIGQMYAKKEVAE